MALPSSRPRLRRSGQTLVIFALTLTVLIAILGLAIDSVRLFDLYARMERAAEAGALAGVIYLPTNYNTPLVGTPANDSAVSRASRETVKNGFGHVLSNNDTTMADYCPANVRSVEIAACATTGQQDSLTVTITETTNVVLLSAIGIGSTTISASAGASYLPTAQLGSRSNTFGDEVECYTGTDRTEGHSCSISDTTQSHLDYYTASLTGPADLIESGDPYVYCAEGPTDTSAVPGGVDPSSSSYAYNGYGPTNHPQWSDIPTYSGTASNISQHCGLPGTTPGNPNQQPAGFAGPMTTSTSHPGGYNYQINVPSGVTGSLWIFNPNYIPGPNGGSTTVLSHPDFDRFVDNGANCSRSGYCPSAQFYKGPRGEGVTFNGNYDAPLFYYNVTYTLYQVNTIFNRTTDVQVASTTYRPYDAESGDLSTHGCNAANQVYDPYWQGGTTPNSYFGSFQSGQGCVSAATIQSQQGCNPQDWCKLSVTGGLTAGTYRLVVEATGLTASTSAYTSSSLDGWGSHQYALKVCNSNTITSPLGSGCGSTGPGGQSGSGSGASSMTIAGWNNDDVILQGVLTNATPSRTSPQNSCVTSNGSSYACFDLACIPSDYAGRTLTVSIFDPGDAGSSNPNGTLNVGIVPPDPTKATVTYPSTAPQQTVDGVKSVKTFNGGQRSYNGLWLNAQVTLAPSYTGTCDVNGTGWWQVMYASTGGVAPTDKVGVRISLIGSPVHLNLG